MTFQTFIDTNRGKYLDWDGAYGAQCTDAYRYYLRDVWQVPQTPTVKGAYQIFNTLPPTFDKFTSGIPQRGDVITWSEAYCPNGHVAMVETADSKGFTSFEQNNPIEAPCGTHSHNYKYVIGWFRPKKGNMSPQYIEQDGKIGFIFDYGQFSLIQWATDPEWGNELTEHFKPEGNILKIVKK